MSPDDKDIIIATIRGTAWERRQLLEKAASHSMSLNQYLRFLLGLTERDRRKKKNHV